MFVGVKVFIEKQHLVGVVFELVIPVHKQN